jgi:hypothetical protein
MFLMEPDQILTVVCPSRNRLPCIPALRLRALSVRFMILEIFGVRAFE